MHNALGLTAPLDPEVSRYYGRPYQVIHAGRFATALHDVIADEAVRNLPKGIGSLNQIIDSTDRLEDVRTRQRLLGLYDVSTG